MPRRRRKSHLKKREENPTGGETVAFAIGGLLIGGLGAWLLYPIVMGTNTTTTPAAPALPATTTPAPTTAAPTAAAVAQLAALGLPVAGGSQTAGGYTVAVSTDGTQVTLTDAQGDTVTVAVTGLTGNLQQGTLTPAGAVGASITAASIAMASLNAAFANAASTGNVASTNSLGLPPNGQSKTYTSSPGTFTVSTSADGSSVTIAQQGGATATIPTSALSGTLTNYTLATTSTVANASTLVTGLNNAAAASNA